MKQIQQERKDVVFFLMMFPLKQIHPESYGKSKAIVCEKKANGDEAALKMLEDAYGRKSLPEASCETDAVDESLKLGESFGLRGTPAMVFEDGSIMKGAVKPDMIKQKLDAKK